MSGKQRIGLLAMAAIVAVVAFVALKPADDDENGGADTAAQTTPGETPTATAPSAPEPPEPLVHVVRLRDFAPAGGVQEIEAEAGETVRITVTSSAEDEIHLHGYDLTRNASAGSPARFKFKADLEGVFEMESHEAEHAGKDPLIARLAVQPK